MSVEIAAKHAVAVQAQTKVWVTLIVPCDIHCGEEALRILHACELVEDLPLDAGDLERYFAAIREVLWNGIEHGGKMDVEKRIRLDLVRTRTSVQFFVKDPGPGFTLSRIEHAAINNPPDDVVHHAHVRQETGMRPGGFGILMAKSYADELIYNEHGNEVLLIKYLAEAH